MLEWFDRLDRSWCARCGAVADAGGTAKGSAARLRTFFRKQRCHYPELVERRLVGIRQAMQRFGIGR